MKKHVCVLLFILSLLILTACGGGSGPTVECTISSNWNCCYGERTEPANYYCAGLTVEYDPEMDQGLSVPCVASTNIISTSLRACYGDNNCPHTAETIIDPNTGKEISEFNYCVLYGATKAACDVRREC